VDLQAIGRDLSKLETIEPPFPRITYDDAVKNLQEGHAKGALETRFEWAATWVRLTKHIFRHNSTNL